MEVSAPLSLLRALRLSPPPLHPLDLYLQFPRDVRADQLLEFVSGTAGGRYWLLHGPNNYRTGNKVFIVGQRSFAPRRTPFGAAFFFFWRPRADHETPDRSRCMPEDVRGRLSWI